MTTQKPSRRGRKRWGELVRFLTETMKTSQNERVRMTAAQRLTDILILREQREQLEMRRELRLAEKGDAPDGTAQPEVPAPAETPEQVTERILERYRQKGEAFEQ